MEIVQQTSRPLVKIVKHNETTVKLDRYFVNLIHSQTLQVVELVGALFQSAKNKLKHPQIRLETSQNTLRHPEPTVDHNRIASTSMKNTLSFTQSSAETDLQSSSGALAEFFWLQRGLCRVLPLVMLFDFGSCHEGSTVHRSLRTFSWASSAFTKAPGTICFHKFSTDVTARCARCRMSAVAERVRQIRRSRVAIGAYH